MIIVTWNINGLRSYQKKYDIREFLKTYHIDILHLQETKLPEGWDLQEELKLTSEWHVYQNTASVRKGYAGVATISKAQLKQLD